MGAYKGEDARYNIVSARVSDSGWEQVKRFAAERGLSVSSAVAMLLMIGLEYVARGGK